jgi:hypothetical protein
MLYSWLALLVVSEGREGDRRQARHQI